MWRKKRLHSIAGLALIAGHSALAIGFFYFSQEFLSLFSKDWQSTSQISMGPLLAVLYLPIISFIYLQKNRLINNQISFYIMLVVFYLSLISFALLILRIDYNRFLLGSWAIFVVVLSAAQIIHIQIKRRNLRVLALDATAFELLQAAGLKVDKAFDTPKIQDLAEYSRLAHSGGRTLDYALVAQAVQRGVPIVHAARLYADATGRVPIEHLTAFARQLSTSRYLYLRARYYAEVALCLCLLPVFVPVLLISVLLVLIADGRPIFYKQPRVTRNNKLFKAFKLRTMAVGADKDGLTTDNDHRIIRFGQHLRSFRIDEIPQLWNIFRGQMSLIGPRAEWVDQVEANNQSFPAYRLRHMVLPGITGWAQVTQGHTNSDEAVREKLERDLYYIFNCSIDLDFLILIKTVWAVLSRFGAR